VLSESIYFFHKEEALSSTRAVQVSLLTAEVATYRLFESEGVIPHFVVGHSVGHLVRP
jgi:malonate decarboxylase epsilon subunit